MALVFRSIMEIVGSRPEFNPIPHQVWLLKSVPSEVRKSADEPRL
jgi:hypothetical protein